TALGLHGQVAAAVELGDAAGGAHAALLDQRRGVVALADVPAGALGGGQVAAVVVDRQGQQVGGRRPAADVDLVDQRRPVGQRLLGGEHRRQRLVVDTGGVEHL